MKKRVVVFGIFDGIHEGHRSLVTQAREHGEELVVIVGRDSSSLQWKGKMPRHPEGMRVKLVSQIQGVDRAVLGDEEQSTYKILEELQPDTICLGYDQEVLQEDLKQWLVRKGSNTPLVSLLSYQPDTFHNSFPP
jgi:cytidyltransferase-like protein